MWYTYTCVHVYFHIGKTCRIRPKKQTSLVALLFLGLHHRAKLIAVFSLGGIWHERATVCKGEKQNVLLIQLCFSWVSYSSPSLAQDSINDPGSLSSWCVVCSDYTAVAKLQQWNPSGCQEGQKEDGFAWLNFILLCLKYWDNLFLIIEEREGKLLKSMQTAFASRFLSTW